MNDDDLRALFSEDDATRQPWVDPQGPTKILARTVYRQPEEEPESASRRLSWWPILAVAATVATLAITPVLYNNDDDRAKPAESAEHDVDLEAAITACESAEPRLREVKALASALFAAPTITMDASTAPSADPFSGSVVLPGRPRFCLFDALTRTQGETRYRMTVINPTADDLTPTRYSGSVSDGALYVGERGGNSVYIAVFRINGGLNDTANRYERAELQRITPTSSSSSVSDHGFHFEAPYLLVTFTAQDPLSPGDVLGVMAKEGEELDWLKAPQYLRAGDARPLPGPRPGTLDLREP